MDFINISLFVSLSIYAILFLLVFLKKERNASHYIYAWLIATLFFWTAAMIVYRFVSLDQSLFWCRILYIAASFIPSAFVYFVYIFPQKDKPSRHFVWLLSSLNVVIIILSIIPGVIIEKVISGTTEKEIIWGSFYFIYVIYIAGLFCLGLSLLYKKIKKQTGVIKRQSQYIFYGSLLSSLVAMFTNLLMLWWGDFRFNWFGQDASLILAIATAYAILKYRFLDIKIFIRKWVFYLFLAAVIMGVYTFSSYILKFLDTSSAVIQYGAVGAATVLISVFLFPRIERFFNKNKLFFKDQYDHSDALRDASSAISSTIDFGSLTTRIFTVFKKIFQIDQMAFILYGSNGDGEKIIGLKSFGFIFDVDGVVKKSQEKIFGFFARNKELVLLQELPQRIIESPLNSDEHAALIKVMEFLRGVQAEVVAPICYKNKLTAILALGGKEKKEIYSSQDIQFLETLVHQLAVALENIRSYQKIKNYSADLRREVESATKELKELNQRQSRFLADIAHELQSPVAILKGNISLMDSEGCTPQSISSSAQSADRLSRLINNLLFLARSDFGKLKIEKENFEFGRLINEVYAATQIFSEQKNVNYILQNIKDTEFFADREKLKSVFLNILSNAFKHVNEGGTVSVIVKKRLNKIRVTIFNSGPGISDADLPHIFERFYRREDGGDKGKSGTGLGLSIAKTIVDEHGGRIWAKNSSNDGVIFGVEL
ncbi:MAG: ATP-binding protein [Patescibacteria group bacterium]|jgi:signal transduction histidine kinase